VSLSKKSTFQVLSGAPLWGRLLASPSNIRLLDRLARGKHFSLLRKYVNYNRKKFYTTDPWNCIYNNSFSI
jgi:hypothetical protein